MKKLALYCFLIFISSCTLDKVIDLELPPYQPKTVLECYIEEGKPYQLLLTKSISYFDSLFPVVNRAFVTVTHKGIIDTLKYFPTGVIDTVSYKFYLNASKNVVKFDYDSPYDLYIKEENGEEIRSSTMMLKPVKIDSIYTTYSSKTEKNVSLFVKFKDDPTRANYYRLIVSLGGLKYKVKNSDDLYSDLNLTSSNLIATVRDRFDKGDTLVITLVHMNKEFYDFNRSVKLAERANGNPFAQPAPIKSNVFGNAIGIFTGYNFDRDTLIVK